MRKPTSEEIADLFNTNPEFSRRYLDEIPLLDVRLLCQVMNRFIWRRER